MIENRSPAEAFTRVVWTNLVSNACRHADEVSNRGKQSRRWRSPFAIR